MNPTLLATFIEDIVQYASVIKSDSKNGVITFGEIVYRQQFDKYVYQP